LEAQGPRHPHNGSDPVPQSEERGSEGGPAGQAEARNEMQRPSVMNRSEPEGAPQIGVYKIFVYSKAFVRVRIIPFLPLPICSAHTNAIRVYAFCPIYDASPTSPLHAIHHTQLILAISCKGQTPEGGNHRRGGPHRGPTRDTHRQELAFTRYCFASKLNCGSRSSFYCPPPHL